MHEIPPSNDPNTLSRTVSNFGLTNAQRQARGLPLPQHGNRPRHHRYSAASFLARNEKLIKTLLEPARRPGGLNSPYMRARKAAGHILVIANKLTHETPGEIMDRLGISEADRARMGLFKPETTWICSPTPDTPTVEENPWD